MQNFIKRFTQLNWKHVALDVVTIFVLTGVGGFLVGYVGQMFGSPLSVGWLALSNFTCGTLGFVYVGYVRTAHRWAHLFAVTLCIWLVSLVNPLLGYSSILQWVLSLVAFLVFMGLGGWIAGILAKRKH